MGKYNFSAMKFEEIERRLEALEQSNERLKSENAALRAANNFNQARIISSDIKNYDMAQELFGIAPQNGEITCCPQAVKKNFQTFYQNIFRAVRPTIRSYNGGETLVYTPISTLSESEYQIYVETLEAVIDIVYYAKNKMQNAKGEKNNGHDPR